MQIGLYTTPTLARTCAQSLFFGARQFYLALPFTVNDIRAPKPLLRREVPERVR